MARNSLDDDILAILDRHHFADDAHREACEEAFVLHGISSLLDIDVDTRLTDYRKKLKLSQKALCDLRDAARVKQEGEFRRRMFEHEKPTKAASIEPFLQRPVFVPSTLPLAPSSSCKPVVTVTSKRRYDRSLDAKISKPGKKRVTEGSKFTDAGEERERRALASRLWDVFVELDIEGAYFEDSLAINPRLREKYRLNFLDRLLESPATSLRQRLSFLVRWKDYAKQ